MSDLVAKLQKDNYLQKKFSVFARYNGESDYNDGDKKLNIKDRFVYAMSVLYMGQETFA